MITVTPLKRVFKKQEVKDEAKDKDLENETIESHPPPLPDDQLYKLGDHKLIIGNELINLNIIIYVV